MPTVTVEYAGPIRPPRGERRLSLELPEGADVEVLMHAAGHGDHELERFGVLVNGRGASLLTKLADGDEVVMTFLAGGG